MTAVKSFRETLLAGVEMSAIIRAERDMQFLEEMRTAKRRIVLKAAGVDTAGEILRAHNIEDPGK